MTIFYRAYHGLSSCLSSSSPKPLPVGASLATLPAELQVEILADLEWDDILRVRQTCRTLADVSRARQVWLTLLQHYFDSVFPKPFPLPRPLVHCSAQDFEDLVLGYFGWPQRHATGNSGHHMLNFYGPTVHFLPGGRWVLLQRTNGSIDYLNLDDAEMVPKPLIPHPFEEKDWLRVNLSFDFKTSMSTLAFNVAISSWFQGKDANGIPERELDQMVISIWSVSVEFDLQGNAVGMASTRLSSFKEKPPHVTEGISLLGDHVTYAFRGMGFVVVNWKQAGGAACLKFPRVYFSDPHPSIIQLLPGGRTLAVDLYSIQIWSLSEGTCSNGPPPVVRSEYDLPVPNVRPLWSVTVDYIRNSLPLSRSSVGGASRFVMETSQGIFGLVIPDIPSEDCPPSWTPLGTVGPLDWRMFTGVGYNCFAFVDGHRGPLRLQNCVWPNSGGHRLVRLGVIALARLPRGRLRGICIDCSSNRIFVSFQNHQHMLII
ncbi:hypothetical protein BKA70DRAFT_1245385 [Coprinopsis sp. MPI-PUGE-AT-0042]|nr:hypothetical protein BKA70DRAFT_1245385 [Coprinopsis sp. MPI-PUGE-AT-0042]